MEDDPVPELVARAKAGDRQAFAALYDQFAPLIRSVGYDATGCLQESEDLCQEVFLQAYRKLGQLHDHARFPGWLMMIARHRCVSWRRTQKQTPRIGLEGIDSYSEASDPDDTISCLLDAIRQLPEKERSALHLFYLMEQPASSAREILGLSNSGFYKTLDRAKRRAASILKNRKAMP
jgi:RNA polymerase sigma-70 factor (ECF subfamily)